MIYISLKIKCMRYIKGLVSVLLFMTMGIGIISSCQKDPEDIAFRNLSKNSPWKVETLSIYKYAQANDEVPQWDTTVYDYLQLKFKGTASKFNNSTGEITVNSQTGIFNYSVGSVGGQIIITLDLGNPNTYSFYPDPADGKEMMLRFTEKKYMVSTQQFFPDFLEETGYYSMDWYLKSDK